MKTAGTSIEVMLDKYCGENDIVTPIYPKISNHTPRNYRGYFNILKGFNSYSNKKNIKRIKHLVKREKFYNHMSALEIKHAIGNEKWETYYKFCVEREPMDKTKSHYSMLKNRGLVHNLDDYFKKGIFANNENIYTIDGRIIVDKIINYNNLDKELREVLLHLGIKNFQTLTVNAKKGNEETKKINFTNNQKEIIRNVFKNHPFTIK